MSRRFVHDLASHAARAAASEVPNLAVRPHQRLRPTRIAAAVQLVVLGGLLAAWQPGALAQSATPAAEQAQRAAERRAYDIPAGPLGEALARFARESGALLAATPEQVQGKTSPGARGTFSTQAALDALLAGTGLQAMPNAQGQFVLREAAGVATLPKVTVSATVVESGTGPVEGFRARNSLAATNVDAPLIETPATVNVLTEDFIDTIGARRLEDAMVYVPGVSFETGTTGGAFPSYNIRGFSTQTSSSSGTFIDGFQVNRQAYIPDLSLYERVDILKGASGLLYGTARPGGVISYVSKRPQAESALALDASVGSYDLVRGSLDATGALNKDKTLLYRLIVTAQQANQTFHGRNDDVSYDDRVIVAPSVRWLTPGGGTLDASFQYYYQDQIFDPGIKRINGQFLFNNAPYAGPESSHTRDHYLGTVEYTQPFNEQWSMYVGGTYQYTDRNIFLDVAPGGPLTGTSLSRTTQDFRSDIRQYQLRAEVRGKFETGSWMRHDLKVGVDYFSSNTDTVSFVGNLPNSIDPFNPMFGPPPAVLNPSINFTNPQNERGLYLQDYISLGEKLKLFGGLRYLDFDNEYRSAPGFSFNQRTEASAIDYTVGTIYNAAPWLNPFVSYSTSTEPQSGAIASGGLVDPREARQIEAGVKSEWLEGRLSTSVSVFEIEQTDKAESDPLNPGFVTLVGDERVQGIELEAVGQITDEISVLAGYSYLDAEITSSTTPALVGTASANTPRNKFSLYGQYEFRTGPLAGLSAGLGVIHVGDRQGDNANTYQLPNYTRWDASIAYRRGPWRMRLAVENLTDKDYVAGTAGTLSGGQRVTQGAKRFITLTAGYDF